MIEKICELCGKAFTAKLNTAKYCCRSCKSKAGYRRLGKRRGTILCPECGKKFHPMTGKQRFCSKSCEGKYSHKHSWSLKERVCHCGNHYMSQRKDMYECHECRRKRGNLATMQSRLKKDPTVQIGIGSGGGQHYTSKANKTCYEKTYRDKAFKAFPNECTLCKESASEVLVVHHLDMDHFNSDIHNLAILCANCHLKLHNRIRQAFKKNTPSKDLAILTFNQLKEGRSKTAELSGNELKISQPEPKARRDSSQGQSVPAGEDLLSADKRPLIS